MTKSSFTAPLAGFWGFCACSGAGFGPVRETMLDRLRLLNADVSDGPSLRDNTLGLSLTGPGVKLEVSLRGRHKHPVAPFTENLLQADCGIMAVHGRAEADPRPLGVDYVSVLAGVAAVQGALAATVGQLRGVAVRGVELAVDRIALLAVGQYVAAATAQEDPERGGEPSRGRPPFASADGVLFELEAFSAEAWQGFWTELGAPNAAVGRAWRPFLLRYERASVSLPRELHDVTGARRYDEIVDIAARTGMHVCRVRTVAERRADPDIGSAPWTFTPAGGACDLARPATGGGLPLSGIHVVESTRRVQGPMATRLLVMLGATVTRIEPPGGDPLRGMPPMAGDTSAKFRALNEGKRTVEIDFKTAEGRAEVLDLVRDADVFVHNWAPGKAAELGLDAPAMHALNPGLVYATASGWGDALGEAPPAGTDYMVQAYAGVAHALSSPDGYPRPTLMIMVDILGGFVSAEGILAALVARHRGGGGSEVSTSLLAAADALLAGRVGASPPSLVDTVFPAKDGRIVVVASETELGTIADVLGLPAGTLETGEDLAKAITKALARKPAGEWERLLHHAGLSAAVVREDLLTLPESYPGAFEDHGCAVVPTPWTFC